MPISALDSPTAPTHMSPSVDVSPPLPPVPPGRTEPLRVVFLTTDREGTASDTVLPQLIRKLNPARYSAEICSLYRLGPLGQDLARTVPSSSGILRHPVDFLAMGRLGRRFKGRVDAVVTLGIDESMFWGCAAARWARLPVSLSIVSASPGPQRLSVWNRLVLPWSDGLIADGEQQREDLIRRHFVPAHKVHVIARGVDTQRFCFQPAGAFAVRHRLGIPTGTPLCGLAAGKASDATLRQLLEVAQRVRSQLPSVHFLLMDAPWSAATGKALLSQVGPSEGVHVLDGRSELPHVYSAMNALAFLSDAHQRPVTVHQAMAVQVPVVATAGSQISALVQTDGTGFLVESGKAWDVATRIVQLLNDPSLARRLGECGRQHIVKYWSLDRMARRYEQLICETYVRKRSGKGPPKPEPLRDAVEFCGASP